jgi:ubiquinone/menaquinone biosynthesis C-methylase UbiE
VSDGSRRSRRYDGQAATYDRRRTLDENVARSAAATALAIAGGEGTVVEIGAGTGEIGRQLAILSQHYVGLDLSRPMLARFRAKLGGGPLTADLVQAECNRSWPLRDGVANAVVAAHVVHLLDPVLVAAEVRRVCRPGGCLLVGRVEHNEHSLLGRLRRERQSLFAARGIPMTGGESGTRRLIACCEAAGATSLGRRLIGEWQLPVTAGDVITEWDTVGAWAGRPVAPAVQAEVQAALRRWAEGEFGTLKHTESCGERFSIEGVRFP